MLTLLKGITMRYMIIYTLQFSYTVEADNETAAREQADGEYAEDCHNLGMSDPVVDIKELGAS